MEHHKHGGQGDLLRQVTSIPTRILRHHDLEGLSGILLHHLCSKECFNLKKAVYFVDNPDFDQLVGIAGFTSEEASVGNVWDEPQSLSNKMRETAFHKRVRQITHASISLKGEEAAHSTEVQLIAKELGIANPQVYSWQMKHGNHGVLVYDGSGGESWDTQDLYNAASLLSFCPF